MLDHHLQHRQLLVQQFEAVSKELKVLMALERGE
jgi:hypothetical protein